MAEFKNIFKGELSKSFKGKGILITWIIVIGISIMMALIFGMTVKEYNKLSPIDEDMQGYSLYDVIDGINIEIRETDLKYAEGQITKYQHDILIYQNKSHKAVIEYMIKNNLKFGDYEMYMGDEMMRTATIQNLILFTLSGSYMIVGIIMAILASGAIADEISGGTMRLLLLCPMGRFRLIFAKLCSIMVQLVIVIFVALFAAIAMGLLMYPSKWIEIMVVFNASKAALIPFASAVLLQIFILFLYGLIMAVIVLAFVSIFRSKVFGIVLGVILSSNIISAALTIRPQLVKYFSFTIFTNMNLNGFFSLTGNNGGQISLPMALMVYIINIIVLLGLSGLLFRERDIH